MKNIQPIKQVTGIKKLSKKISNTELFNSLNIHCRESEKANILKQGEIILVSNRPVGVVEEFIISKLVADIRDDLYFLANEFLEETDSASLFKFYADIKKATHQTKANQNILSIFPVGNISTFQTPQLSFTDSKWDKNIIEEILLSNIPVVPVYINALDDSINKLLGMLHPALKVRRFVNYLLDKKTIDVKVRIGKPVEAKKLEINNAEKFGRFLRAKLYSLGTSLEVEKFYTQKYEEPIVSPVPADVIEKELHSIKGENLIYTQGDFELYLAKAKKIPKTLKEIGRLREITFRKVGEGTLKSIDLDEYDLYYLHLFLWDTKQKKIAGAYRIGAGDYIMKSIGKKGFYLRSLFKMNKQMNPVLEHSIELGRSFVTPEYQKQRLPLFLLWKGIAYFIKKNPHLHYIIGPVSISGNYSKLSRSLMVAFIKKYYWDERFAKMVTPKKKFKPDLKSIDIESLLETVQNDEKKFDSILEDMEPNNMKMPVLFKKYFRQNGRIIAFNLDPKFNDALDGFMITEISKLPKDALETF
ncbi:MAG: lysophospholipid acyltransferase family protein [Chitinophagales bacterium]|nr:lysophospholipid acyltransferase family protein [Chitinophagales bacterium]MDW8273648.1 lysophospholipid acyltransferase family protein [Chitinophagales bacterium]